MHPIPSRLTVLLACALAGCGGAGARGPVPEAAHAPSHEPVATMPTPTAFSLPSDFTAWQQSPVVAPEASVLAVPGVAFGTFQGLEAVLVETAHASAAVALFGGQVLSSVPRGGQDVFWLSPLRAALPTPVRGGIPVCWPYFGRQGQGEGVPSHGFVRTLPWRLVEARAEDEGVTVVLEPPALQGLDLRVRSEVHVGRQLRQRLVTTNTGGAPVVFTEALHNYFRVADVEAVRVEGLDGLTYLDKNDGYRAYTQQGDWILADPRDPGRSDRTYPGAGGRYRLVDPGLGRAIELQVQGGRSDVVWHPGEAAAARMADLGPYWRGFLCVEAANAGPDVVALDPGRQHVLEQRITVTPLP